MATNLDWSSVRVEFSLRFVKRDSTLSGAAVVSAGIRVFSIPGSSGKSPH